MVASNNENGLEIDEAHMKETIEHRPFSARRTKNHLSEYVKFNWNATKSSVSVSGTPYLSIDGGKNRNWKKKTQRLFP